MNISVIIPQIGQSIAEATIIKWFKKPGDRIEKGEPLVEIGTDKLNTELPAPESGVVAKLLVAEGQIVPVATEIAILSTEPASKGLSASSRVEPEGPAPSRVEPEQAASVAKPEFLVPHEEPLSVAIAAEEIGQRMRSSPLVRKLAQEHNVDLRTVSGTGGGGRVSKEDILRVIDEGKAGPVGEAAVEQPPGRPVESQLMVRHSVGPDVERVPMTRMRKLIAEHMRLSRQTAADVTTFFEMDMTEVVRQREKARDAVASQYQVKLTYLPFIMAAVARALRAFPVLNSSIDKDEILIKKNINIGIAVALENGLIVPVIKNVDEKNIAGLAREAQDLSERARSNRLKPEDLEDGTFTITNPGVFGALMGTPIIYQPQVAILGIGAVVKRAIVINDAIAIRSMSTFSLSYDHRALDGSTADQFLAYVKQILESETPSAVS